jgi:hypothetical protein
MDFPDTPEAVALALLDRILEREPEDRHSNKSAEQRVLGLYAQCLATVMTDRSAGSGVTMH